MRRKDLGAIAFELYLDGWRYEDRRKLKREFDFTDREVAQICDYLMDYEDDEEEGY